VNLFQLGDFTLHSGAKSKWKIECDALTSADWEALAQIASEILPPFGYVEGVPCGGIPFAIALRKHITPDSITLLIAEDVTTTGASLNRYRDGRAMTVGVVAFCRGVCPEWVTPLFVMPARAKDQSQT
jgi:orotate phosphoribosyltransferase